MPHNSVIVRALNPSKRTVKKVPFVELFSGRVQGVVSSGSDVKRVYVSFLEADTGNYYCCTNNNRPCGGLRGSPCKHIHLMIDEAILQFGTQNVTTYLGLSGDDASLDAQSIVSQLLGDELKESPGVVFSRFLTYLRYCELETPDGSVPEMSWFVS